MKRIKLFQHIDEARSLIEENQARTLVIGSEKICLARFKNQFYAIQDHCPHRKESLSKGKVNNKGEIICPLHSYVYSLISGREYQQKTEDAKTWKVVEEGEALFIELD